MKSLISNYLSNTYERLRYWDDVTILWVVRSRCVSSDQFFSVRESGFLKVFNYLNSPERRKNTSRNLKHTGKITLSPGNSARLLLNHNRN